MRILHILNEVPNVGNGIVNAAVDLACAQSARGDTVAVASGGGGYETLLQLCGVLHVTVPQRRVPSEFPRGVVALWRLLRAFDPHIVHAHMMTGAVLARALRPWNRYSLVTTVHNVFQSSSRLMAVGDRVIAVSDGAAADMSHRGIPREKLRVVYNGPLGSPRKAEVSRRPPACLARPAIVTVAGLYARKGISDLLDAFARIAEDFPAAHLYIVGDGPDRLLLRRRTATLLCCNRVHFEGFQPYPEDYLRAADIFVLSSHTESCPLVIAEARGAGIAIISTEVNGVPKLLEFGEAGIMVPPRDPPALAEMLRSLLAEPVRIAEWRERASRNLKWLRTERVEAETTAIYRELVPAENSR